MHKSKAYFVTLAIAVLTLSPMKATPLPTTTPEKVGMSTSILTTVDEIINSTIANKDTPGAVLLVAHKGKIVYKKAYGNRMLKPRVEKMTLDTIFDMASLTKPSATACGIMLLAQDGKLNVNDKVSKYIPEFAQNGKEDVTIANLLVHDSGLKAGGNYFGNQFGYLGVINNIASLSPTYPPGTKYVYSDLGYITLCEIIRRVSGKPENEFVAERIYKPLGMKDTGFLPPKNKLKRCAPTEFRDGKWLQGQVHDPTAFEMGGVAGHAGLFSTADDMAILCQMLLNGGEYNGVRIFTPESVRLMTNNQSPLADHPRGFGWGVGPHYAGQSGNVGFGHTGWTGTYAAVDPVSQTIVIILRNRNHPDGKGDIGWVPSQKVTDIVSSSIIKE